MVFTSWQVDFLSLWIYERSLSPFHLWCHWDAPISASRLLHILSFSSECPGDVWLLNVSLNNSFWDKTTELFGAKLSVQLLKHLIWHLQKYIWIRCCFHISSRVITRWEADRNVGKKGLIRSFFPFKAGWDDKCAGQWNEVLQTC